ncbi:hypothetical protein [Cellulomonas fengjieae]|uniref:Uncharacterized protein n=1 Tax=Cellulomonas fengjieae TaxID=2819978 RepID=A0ABS3SKB0_9CELL|nr:hypothetical protein [Cellulomonas fengjieae]MBO3086102.1 hypothetical protein [Cellulomonas fengjieae]MBO3102494.1 hypothetical protein [Cellulomonas fengjieae]QVI65834.1 hypothetical protein KG102_17450 [Cellulomonas fengjieae]
MVALTYEVHTLRIPIPRLVLRSSRARLARRVPEPLEPWQQTERRAHEKRRDAHLDAAVALRR